MKTTEFLDAVRARHGLTSDYQLARFLGVKQPTVSRYRTGGGSFDEAMCLKIARALELEPGYVLAAIAAERAKPAEVKAAWSALAKRLAAAVGAAAIAIPAILQNQDVQSFPGELARVRVSLHICANSARRALKWAVAAFAAGLRGLALALLLCAPARASDWRGADTGRELAYQGLLTVDCLQTWAGYGAHPDQFSEMNPLLPKHPSKTQLSAICAGTSVGHYLVSRWLSPDAREFWQVATIGAEFYVVVNNYFMAGVRIRF